MRILLTPYRNPECKNWNTKLRIQKLRIQTQNTKLEYKTGIQRLEYKTQNTKTSIQKLVYKDWYTKTRKQISYTKFSIQRLSIIYYISV